jgi:hypothetical protein
MAWSFVLSPDDSGLPRFWGMWGSPACHVMPVYGVYFLRKARAIHL